MSTKPCNKLRIDLSTILYVSSKMGPNIYSDEYAYPHTLAMDTYNVENFNKPPMRHTVSELLMPQGILKLCLATPSLKFRTEMLITG